MIRVPYIFGFLLLLFGDLIQAQDYHGFYDKYKDEKQFTSVNLGEKMFEAMAKRESENLTPDIIAMLKDLDGLKLVSTAKSNKAALFERSNQFD